MSRPEIWRSIPGYVGLYEVSDRGRVRSLDCVKTIHARWGTTKVQYFGRILCASTGDTGYLHVTLCDRNGKQTTRRVHNLVALAFFGPPPMGKVVLHGSGDKTNCRKKNLRYGTAKENAEDAVRHRTQVHGERHPMAKLTEKDVRRMRGKFRSVPYWRVAEVFNVSKSAIAKVMRKELWRHVA